MARNRLRAGDHIIADGRAMVCGCPGAVIWTAVCDLSFSNRRMLLVCVVCPASENSVWERKCLKPPWEAERGALYTGQTSALPSVGWDAKSSTENNMCRLRLEMLCWAIQSSAVAGHQTRLPYSDLLCKYSCSDCPSCWLINALSCLCMEISMLKVSPFFSCLPNHKIWSWCCNLCYGIEWPKRL